MWELVVQGVQTLLPLPPTQPNIKTWSLLFCLKKMAHESHGKWQALNFVRTAIYLKRFHI